MSFSIFDEQIFQISFNASNLVSTDTSNACYRYSFPTGIQFNQAKVAVTNVSMYYSWYNITAVNGNNTYQYTFTQSGVTTTYTVTMPDGYYSVSDLNTFLQADMISNGLYLVDSSGDFVYYLEILENPTYYALQFNTFAFPTALPSGYTNPNSLTFDGTAYCTQFIIPATNFSTLVGLTAGTYPAVVGAADVSTLSDLIPQIDPVESMILSTNLINNRFSNPPTLMYPFTTGGVSFGSLISSSPNNLLYLDVQSGQYNEIEICFLDQNYNKLPMRDTNITVQLAFIVYDPRKKNIA